MRNFRFLPKAISIFLSFFCGVFSAQSIGMASSNPSSTLLVGQALYFFNQNKLDESLLQWQKVIELDPNHKLAKEYIEKINTIQSRHTGNVTEYYSPETSQRAKILSIQQLMSREAENLAFSYIDKQIYDEAIAIWREMLKRNPEDTKINAYLALTFLKAGKYDQSLLQWQKILSYDPENVQAQAYEKLLSESTYEDLDNVARTLAMPRPQTSLLGEISDQQPAFIFEGLESSTIINTYITNGHVAKKDENTFHVGEKLKIKNRLYGDPLNIVVANDLYRSHGDTLNNVTTGSGVGSVEDGDYELFDRPRQATVQYYGKELQLLVGDIHSHYLFSKNPSHFVYQGIDYRGINLLYEKEKFRTKLMWGYMPFYEPRTSFSGAKRGSNQGTLNRLIGTRKRILFDRDYLYPREILGIDFRYELHPRYVIGAIFTKTEDHSHIKDISTFLPYTDNYLVSFTQSINFFPGKRIEDVTPKPEYVKGEHKENAARFFSYLKETFKWHVFQEFAYAWTDLDFDKSIPLYSNADLTTRSQNFDDWAIYTFSEMSLPKFHNQTLHQRIGPEFRNPQGFTYAQTVTYDRDYISSKSYYYPLDNFNVALNVSQLKSDLDKDLLIAEKDWRSAKLNVRWLPGGIWPNVTLGGKYDNYRSPDTSIYVANDWEMWAYTFGLNKEILGWDIFSNYKMTINDDDQDNFEKTFVNHFSVEAFKTIFPGIDLIFGHFFTEQDVNAPIPANFFDRDYNHTDITLNFDLWDTSYMSLLYSYLEDIDNFDTETVPEKAKINSFSFTFGWPLYIRPDQEKDQYLDITPFFTVLVNDSGRREFNNVIVEPSLQIKYNFDKKSYMSILASYRHDTAFESELRMYSYINYAFDAHYVKIDDAERQASLSQFTKRVHAYTIGLNDQLHLQIVKRSDYSVLDEATIRVDQAGYVSAPFIPDILIRGLTLEEATHHITEKVSHQYTDFNVQLTQSNYWNDKIVVTGEVRNPGVYPLKSDLTVFEAIALAGGTSPYHANHSDIEIKRPATGEIIVVNLERFIIQNDYSQNIPLQSGDIVKVQRTPVTCATDFLGAFLGKHRTDKTLVKKAADLDVQSHDIILQE